MIWTGRVDDTIGYRLAPFVVGFYEAHLLETRDPEFARLVEEYFCGGAGCAVGIMGAQPAIHRVVPARGATETEWVLPYDDVRALLARATSFRVEKCVCRLQQEELGARRCDFPIEACLWFSFAESGDEAGGISHEEALAVLDEAERVGLVHTVSNVAGQRGPRRPGPRSDRDGEVLPYSDVRALLARAAYVPRREVRLPTAAAQSSRVGAATSPSRPASGSPLRRAATSRGISPRRPSPSSTKRSASVVPRPPLGDRLRVQLLRLLLRAAARHQ